MEKSHKFEGEWEGMLEGLEEGKGREKFHNYLIISKNQIYYNILRLYRCCTNLGSGKL